MTSPAGAAAGAGEGRGLEGAAVQYACQTGAGASGGGSRDGKVSCGYVDVTVLCRDSLLKTAFVAEIVLRLAKARAEV